MAGDLAISRCCQASLGSSRGAAGQKGMARGQLTNQARQVKWESVQFAWLLGWRKCQFFFFLTQNYSLPTSSLSVFTYYFFNIQITTALQILKEGAALKQEVTGLSRRARRLGPPS